MTPRSQKSPPRPVTELNVELAAVVARGSFPVAELDRLRPGDVLSFPRRHDAPLEVLLDGVTVGSGRAVERADRLALLVEEITTPDCVLATDP